MNLWSEDDYELAEITLVPSNLKSNFTEFIQCDLIKPDNELIFFVSYNCLDSEDISFIKTILDYKFRRADVYDLINFLTSESRRYNFGNCTLFINSQKKKTMLQARYYNSLKEVFFLMNEMLNSVIVGSPFTSDDFDVSWLDSPLFISELFKVETAYNYLDSCLITSSIKENLVKLREFSRLYSCANHIKKLALLSSWYLFSSVVSSSRGDQTKAVLLLHRATETCFKSWLLAEQQISIDRNGDVIRDSHTYLLGYMELLKTERSFTDVEVETINSLNESRNKSKYAHGFTSLTKTRFDCLFAKITSFILEDNDLRWGFNTLESVFKLPKCINDMTYEFLIRDNYLVRF